MSGKRCKALRREFKQRTGVAPKRAVTDIVMRTIRWFGKRIQTPHMDVIAPSEWRQIKKAYKARRAA